MKSCSTLSRNRITSSMKVGCSDHSNHVSKFNEHRQHTAVRSRPFWSRPVGSVISLHRFDVFTSSPASLWCSGRARFTWSEKIRYGSPVSIRAVRMRIHNPRAEIDRTTDPSFGDTSGHASSASTARMNASDTRMP